MATAKRTLPLAKRGFSFEMIMWAFTRFTVLAMYGLILAGIIGGLIVSAQLRANFGDVLRWAFFPNMAANPLSGMLWMTILARLMVSAFVMVVCGHGVHGILEILDDYFTGDFVRRWFRNIVIAYAIVATIIALYVIWFSQ
jgi:succinate dehydrogenase hydrophobic anchor subunit